MKKNVLTSSVLITLGIAIGILLVSEYSPNSINKVFPLESKKIGATNAPTTPEPLIQTLNDAFVNVSEAAKKSVVHISVEGSMESQQREIPEEMQEFFRFFGNPNQDDSGERRVYGSGSGVIISSDGYVVTNNHVIENAINGGIKVRTSDKKEYTAEVIGTDPLTDLAVLKIDENGLTPAHFSNPDDLKIGQIVLAVGSPLGLQSTVTQGIVSATGRGRLGLFNGEGRSYSVEHFIQTDAAINPGNSGGGLFDINGSLVGINTAIASRTGGFIGYGFAIPMDLAKSVMEDLIEDGKVNRGYIGVQISSVEDPTYAKSLGLEEVRGVLIERIMEGSAAEEAGLEELDVILEIEGEKLYTSNQLQSEVSQKRAGDFVSLKIWREDKTLDVKVKLKPRDDEDLASLEVEEEEEEKEDLFDFENLGFEVASLNDEVQESMDIDYGVIITQVERYSEAQKRGLFVGGVILKADREKVNSPKDLARIFANKSPGDGILLQVQYENGNRIVALEIPNDTN